MATTRRDPCLFIHLFIFPSCHHAKSNADFMFQFACFHPVFCVSSSHLSSLHRIIHCSPKLYPPCTLKSICLTLICILFIHTCLSSISIINIESLPDNIPRPDVTEQAKIQSISERIWRTGWTDPSASSVRANLSDKNYFQKNSIR